MSANAGDVVIDQFPLPSTSPVQRTVPSESLIVTVSPVIQVPVIVGVVSFVAYGDVASHPAVNIVGASGAIESISILTGTSDEVFPAISV